jgi:hypothetical protein
LFGDSIAGSRDLREYSGKTLEEIIVDVAMNDDTLCGKAELTVMRDS